jgi:hypothetical protein
MHSLCCEYTGGQTHGKRERCIARVSRSVKSSKPQRRFPLREKKTEFMDGEAIPVQAMPNIKQPRIKCSALQRFNKHVAFSEKATLLLSHKKDAAKTRATGLARTAGPVPCICSTTQAQECHEWH